MDIKKMTNNELINLVDDKETRDQLSNQEFYDIQNEIYRRLRNAPEPLVIPEGTFQISVVVTDTFDRVYYIKAESDQEALDIYNKNGGPRGTIIYQDINSTAEEEVISVFDPDGNEVRNIYNEKYKDNQ